jgi:hypothetical protein
MHQCMHECSHRDDPRPDTRVTFMMIRRYGRFPHSIRRNKPGRYRCDASNGSSGTIPSGDVYLSRNKHSRAVRQNLVLSGCGFELGRGMLHAAVHQNYDYTPGDTRVYACRLHDLNECLVVNLFASCRLVLCGIPATVLAPSTQT